MQHAASAAMGNTAGPADGPPSPSIANAALEKGTSLLYGEMTLVERVGPESGAHRLDMIKQHYQEQDSPHPTIPWFVHGTRHFKRHELNQRSQACVKRRLVKRIKDKGIVYGVRGEPWVQCPGALHDHFRCIGWGSLIDAAYRCFQHHPDNDDVKRVLRDGVAECSCVRVKDAR